MKLRYWQKNIHDADDVLGAFHDGVGGDDGDVRQHSQHNNCWDREH